MADKKDPENTPENEDRNIAKVDVETPGLTPEEQLVLLWDKYKSPVIGAAVIALVGSAAWFGKKAMDEQALRSVQAEYTKAAQVDKEAQEAKEKEGEFDVAKDLAAIEASLEFARNNSNHTLGGHARLKAGHAYFKAKQYSEAAEQYMSAANSLTKVHELAGLAKLYQALATWRSGQEGESKTLFIKIAENKDYLHGHRGEAFFKLGVIALAEQNLQEYAKWETALQNASLTHSQTDWLERLQSFRGQFPKEGFDPLGPIPAEEPPAPPTPAPAAASVTGGTSGTSGASTTGSASPTGN